MLKSSLTIKIHRPGFKKFKTSVHTHQKTPVIKTHDFEAPDCIISEGDISLHAKIQNASLCCADAVINSENPHLASSSHKADFIISHTSCIKPKIKLKTQVIDRTDAMRQNFFPARQVYKSDLRYDDFERELKNRMIRKKITSREYIIHGIFANMPEPLEYKYDFGIKKLMIRVPESLSSLSNFAIIEMLNDRNKILKIPLENKK